MKEFNKLLQYRSYYEYDFECEALRVIEGELHDEAKALYSHIVRDFFLKDDDKWALDIALDCIHNLKEDDIEFVQKQGEIFDYHFGYGMYVRNHYVHPSKLHVYFMADSVSGRVAAFLYTILLPTYNCLSEHYMKLISDFDFEYIEKQYKDTQPIIEEMLVRLADFSNDIDAKQALKIIIKTIRENLGKDGFKNTIIPIVQEHVSKHKYINIEWKELVDKLYTNTRIYNKEYNQLKAIKDLEIISKIASPYPSVTTLDEAREYIVENLGFSDEDALLMAECAFEMARIQESACEGK